MTKICGVGKLMNRHVPWGGSGGGGSLPPELRDALIGVWVVGKKTNDSPDRTIIKNKIPNAGGDFQLLNFAYKLNSGYGEYGADFESFDWTTDITKRTSAQATIGVNGRLCNHAAIEIGAMKVNIKGNVTDLRYWYIANPDDTARSEMQLTSGVNVLPKSYAKDDGQTYNVGFAYISGDPEITIEQIPSWQGAIRTDGVSDLIVSMKTAQEMGIESACTFVSMMGSVVIPSDATFNNMRNNGAVSGRNGVQTAAEGTTGIFGWSKANVGGSVVTVINNVLGDKNNYKAINGTAQVGDQKFSVEGFQATDGTVKEVSQVAWYWTFGAKKVLTSDEINQVIAYFNLDRTLNPDILCNTIKQGITNENHAEFGDKLIDFSGNGRDIQLNNIAWKGDSGIGKYGMDFLEWKKNSGMNFTSTKLTGTKPNLSGGWLTFRNVSGLISETKVKVSGAPREFGFIGNNNGTDDKFSVTINNGVYTIPEFTLSSASGFYINNNSGDWSNLVIEQIPSHAGALCLDGINDFGKVTGMPVYKDYTVVTDREIFANIGAILSKNNPGAFVETAGNSVYSFGQATSGLKFISTRSISYLSKYSYCGQSIAAGAAEDVPDMWLGTIRDGDSRFFNGAIYSLMSFPYSMSEFLIERQLKKHKLGTLYPDMVEFRPIIKANANYKIFYTALLPLTGITWEEIKVGDYVAVGRRVAIQLSFDNEASELVSAISSQLGNISITKNSNNKGYTIFGDILKDKSPQKINITIDEYIRYEDIDFTSAYPFVPIIEGYTWGDKLKVGSSVTYKGFTNLLSEYFNRTGEMKLNGNDISYNTPFIVNKINKFEVSRIWIADGNEPKCILYPERLSIPNGSYQILGYIPDLSGHGNNGRFNNFAFSGMSGANGYSLDFTKYVTKDVLYTDSTIEIQPGVTGQKWLLLILPNNEVKPFKLRISGIPSNKQLIWQIGSERIELFNGINEIKGYNVNANSGIYIPLYSFVGLKIEQIGEYEGAICFDGVTDFIDVPNAVGGKQVLMKVNVGKNASMLYDQRTGNNSSFAIYSLDVTNYVAYNRFIREGGTYIDGILNKNVLCSELMGVTHNIVCTNGFNSPMQSPTIGANFNHIQDFAKVAMFCFMLFDNISTDEEITELNSRIGVEAKVSYPEYYWDAYGKTNDDATDIDGNRAVMPNKNGNLAHLGLSLYNFAYNEESGYGGQGFIRKFATEPAADTWQMNKSRLDYTASDDGLSVNITKVNSKIALFWTTNPNAKSYYEITGISSSGQAIKFGTDQTGYDYSVIADKDGIYEVDWSLLVNSKGTLASACILSVEIGVRNITIKQVTQYQNGLLLDGVNDYLANNAIPVLSDFTCMGKRLFLPSMAGSRPYVVKGDRINSGGIGNAFLMEFNGGTEQYSFGTKNQNTAAEVPALISYMTPTSYNGKAISRGTGVDTAGLFVGGTVSSAYTPMVFYKLMLYTKSLTTLEINYLKNMFARDEIIDLGNPIFLEAAPPPAISIDWTSWQYVPTSATATVQPHEFNLTKVLKSGMFLQINGLTTEIPSMKVKVTGAVKESYLVYQYCIKEDDLIHVVGLNADGEYVLPASYHSEGLHWTGFKANPSAPDLDLKVEILEQY